MASDEGPVPERTVTVCERYAHLTAMLIATTYAGLCGIGSCRDQHASASSLRKGRARPGALARFGMRKLARVWSGGLGWG